MATSQQRQKTELDIDLWRFKNKQDILRVTLNSMQTQRTQMWEETRINEHLVLRELRLCTFYVNFLGLSCHF